MKLDIRPRALFAAIVASSLVYCIPAQADVVGTISSGTDTVITWIRAAAAIYIIYLALTAQRQGIWGVIGGIAAIAVAISARTIAGGLSFG